MWALIAKYRGHEKISFKCWTNLHCEDKKVQNVVVLSQDEGLHVKTCMKRCNKTSKCHPKRTSYKKLLKPNVNKSLPVLAVKLAILKPNWQVQIIKVPYGDNKKRSEWYGLSVNRPFPIWTRPCAIRTCNVNLVCYARYQSRQIISR